MTLTAPWLSQPGEAQRAFSAFVIYRDLGPDRTYIAAWRLWAKRYKLRKKPSSNFMNWTRGFEWERRANAYDRATINHDSAEQVGALVAILGEHIPAVMTAMVIKACEESHVGAARLVMDSYIKLEKRSAMLRGLEAQKGPDVSAAVDELPEDLGELTKILRLVSE